MMKTFKRLLPCALALLLLLSLCACSRPTAVDPPEPPVTSEAPSSAQDPATEPSAVSETEPATEPESVEPTEPHYFDRDWWAGETPEAKLSSYSGVVLTPVDGKRCTYELPHIDMPGDYIKDLNREIYNTFMTNPANFEYIRYSYYVLGNYLTVVIESYASAPTGASVVEYNIYTVDIEKSRPAKTSEILEAAGMTAEEFHEKALAALLKPYQEDLVKFSMTDTERDAEAETESFLDSAYPYFAEDGSLWVHGRRLTIAGQGSCNAIAPLESAE